MTSNQNAFYHLSASLPKKPCTFNPLLTTPRLTLTLHDPRNDTDTNFALFCAQDPANYDNGLNDAERWHGLRSACLLLSKYTPNKTPVIEPAVYSIRLGDDPEGERIGMVMLNNRHEDTPPDLGWTILSAHQRQGYASEAAERLFRYFRDEFQGGLQNASPPIPITAVLDASNAGSVGVAKKIGMEMMGDLRMVFPKAERTSVWAVPGTNLGSVFASDIVINVFGVGDKGLEMVRTLFGSEALESGVGGGKRNFEKLDETVIQ